jgi:CheY-like chemotaxis protein
MTVKTCLLVTDDPDDHQAFSEAFSEISETAVVLIVLDSQKALGLLKNRRHKPDYIFMDLSMHGIRINTFLNSLRGDQELKPIPTVVYGNEVDLSKIDQINDFIYFNKQYEYSELRDFLKQLFENNQEL